jgi:uncharacterized membrane protein AbrB (regulator of aidB expression)
MNPIFHVLDGEVQMPSLSDSTLSHIILQPIIAQKFEQDVLKDLRKGWEYFYSSGQIWALLVGLVVGYLIKSITSSH